MRGVSVRCAALLLVTALAGEAWGFHSSLRRYTRQAIHCQAEDTACQMCSNSCNSVEESRLPECCEAYKTCCDQYFQACKKCSSVVVKDRYFPEYCCASFTDCCDLVTTFTAPIKPPEPVRSKESKPDLKVPTVAAPKPTVFPGIQAPAAPLVPALAPQAPSLGLPSHDPAFSAPSPRSQASRVSVGKQRVQQNSAQPRPKPRPQSNGNRRHGRVTSRGRVIE